MTIVTINEVELDIKPYANLLGADLYGADLYGADLSGADLSGANLSGANLHYADLLGASGVIYAGLLYSYHISATRIDGAVRIFAGCHSFSIEDARKYWSNKPDRRLTLPLLDYIEVIAPELLPVT